jgi:hypothetical protein
VDKNILQMRRRRPKDVSIVGDAKEVLGHLIIDLPQKDNDHFLTQCCHPKNKLSAKQSAAESSQDSPIKPQFLARGEALASKHACVLDVHRDPNEWVMPPKLEVSQALNYTIAKSKELLNSND